MQIAEHIAAIANEGNRLASAAGRAGLDARVPTCPDRDTRDLLRHLGLIRLWAASVSGGAPPPAPAPEPSRSASARQPDSKSRCPAAAQRFVAGHLSRRKMTETPA